MLGEAVLIGELSHVGIGEIDLKVDIDNNIEIFIIKVNEKLMKNIMSTSKIGEKVAAKVKLHSDSNMNIYLVLNNLTILHTGGGE